MNSENMAINLLMCFTPYESPQRHWDNFALLCEKGYMTYDRLDNLGEVPRYRQKRLYKLTESGKEKVKELRAYVKSLHIHRGNGPEYYISNTGFYIKVVQSPYENNKLYCRYQVWQRGTLYDSSILLHGGDYALFAGLERLWNLLEVEKKPEG